MASDKSCLKLQLVHCTADNFYFSQPILSWHHNGGPVFNQDLAGLIRSFLLSNSEGKIVITNSYSYKDFLLTFAK
jgi:hypothetical protein